MDCFQGTAADQEVKVETAPAVEAAHHRPETWEQISGIFLRLLWRFAWHKRLLRTCMTIAADGEEDDAADDPGQELNGGEHDVEPKRKVEHD